MDVSRLLKSVNNLNDYISATQDVVTKFSNSKILFNMSTILALNKIRAIEIEFFNKCDDNGVAIKILELMLQTPPSKSWSLLGKELISLVQYWLESIRKHLISNNNNWWNFLSILLKFVKEISLKNPTLNDILVQETAESLLDIATRDVPDVDQKYKIIQCLNKFCSESSREVRFALRNTFEIYFIKLSRLMASCGDLRTQFTIIETLLRWLLPRQDPVTRKDASSNWFPSTLYDSKAIDIFLKRTWHNFFKDARDFLNAINESNDVVTSVLCRRFSVGRVVLISATDNNDYWIDLNSGSKCISMMLEAKHLEVLGNSLSISDSIVISEDNTSSVQMCGVSELLITITVIDPLRLYPSNVLEGSDVSIVISTRSDTRRVDKALRSIFADKYQSLIDLNKSIKLSPRRTHEKSRRDDNTSENEKRFSQPVEVPRRKHSGYVIWPRNPISWQSPSTASTSSLAMLREKLTAFPGYTFDKEPVSVCAFPQLSNITEVTEADERYSLNASLSTLKLRSYGVCNKKKSRVDKTKSDTEGVKEKQDKTKCISPVNNDDDNSISCLLVATIGSADDSVINDTLERLPKDKDIHTDNIVDMLAREALNSTRNIEEDKVDSGFLTNDRTLEANNKYAIEETLLINETVKKSRVNKKCIKLNNSTTTDESNTEVIEDTPHIVNIKNKNLSKDTVVQQTFDNGAVEDFFSQHFIENRDGDIIISPTLAKKINETSSESSEFDICPIMSVERDFNEIEIIECLNEIIDTVCKDFEKCSEYLNENLVKDDKSVNKDDPQTLLIQKVTNQNKTQEKPKSNQKAIKDIKLKFTNTRKQAKTRGRKKNKLDLEIVKRMSPIIERNSVIENTDIKNSPEIPKHSDDSNTPLIRRKRKLYSPKDDNMVNERIGVHVSETEEDNSILPDTKINENTPKSFATSYKDIENLRRRSLRKLRDRKSRSVPSFSPRTKKMNDMFDNLKKTIEGEEKVIYASKKTRNKKLAVYNFTSDSDDEDFKIKKNTSRITTKSSVESTARRKRNTPKVNYSELNNDSTDEQNKNIKRKYVSQKTKSVDRKNKSLKPKYEIIDERMRGAAPEILNMSLIIEQKNEELNELGQEPILIEPQMELITEENASVSKKKGYKRNKTDLSLKKLKSKQNKIVLEVKSDRENTGSPLPGLIVETANEKREADESISEIIFEKIKDIGQEDTLPDIPELSNTQNLLSDIDHNNNSPSKLNKTDESIKDIENQQYNFTPIQKIKTEKTKKRITKIVKTKHERKKFLHAENITNLSQSNIDIIIISDRGDNNSEKSIATIGKSPITGHGDFDESPPTAKQLKEIVQARGLETQDLNQSMKEYFDKLTNELNEMSNNSLNNSNNITLKEKEIVEKSKVSVNSSFQKSPSVSIQRLSAKEISSWLPPRYNSVFGSHQSSVSDTSSRKTRSYTKKSHNNQSNLENITTEKTTQKVYKSIISPVKLFGELNVKEKSFSSQGDDYVDRIKRLMTSKKEIFKPQTNTNSEINSPRYYLRKHNSQENSCSRNSKLSASTDVNDSGRSLKRKSSPVFGVKKMRKTEDKNSIESVAVESGPSCSSVQDWLKRNERDRLVSTAESLDLSLRDSLENVIEKLDTTLAEIHHKTSKKFVSMFVDTQKNLTELKEKRHQMFKETAMEVMSEVVKVMNDKFANFDRRSQELDEQFIENLKEKAQNLIHEDCKQKRVMVKLLKEDIQTVMERIKMD